MSCVSYKGKNRAIENIKGETIKEGYLQKQNGSFQRWKQYYFKLYPQKIYYAKSPAAVYFHELAISDISIAETKVNNINSSFKVIVGNSTLVLLSDTRRHMEEWMTAFKIAGHQETGVSDFLSGEHHWYSNTHVSRSYFCNVCRASINGVTSRGLSCEVCRLKAHKKCAAKASKHCKWTTRESIPPEIRFVATNPNELPMPHQWIEGNTADKRCVVCMKYCGDKRLLKDWTCLWCDSVVHKECQPKFDKKCSLGLNAMSIISPMAIKYSCTVAGAWENAITHHYNIPLIVFVNTKSGDNQGISFMRRFKQLLNPAQVFDLSLSGPTKGLTMCKQFEQFRILVCGGDGSVGWVMTELDKLNITSKCQIGVLPLGTGNDLARIFGWGTSCYDVSLIPHILQQLERAKPCMLDRWGIVTKEFPSGKPECHSYFGYEDSIAMHITRMLASNQYDVVIQSARVLCQTVKDFVELVGEVSSTVNEDRGEELEKDSQSLSSKCLLLQYKLTLLLRTLKLESEASTMFNMVGRYCRSSTMENLEESLLSVKTGPMKWHSDTTLNVEPRTDHCNSEKIAKKKFVPKEHLWSRANSLKKAMREIIDHAEKAVDCQNRQTMTTISSSTSLDLTKVIDTVNISQVIDELPETNIDEDLHKDEGNKKVPPICVVNEPQTLPFSALQGELLMTKNTNTVVYPGTVIARAFQKSRLMPGFISKVLLANANAFCATAISGVEGEKKIENFKEKCVMNNYFGVGIDAKISLDFHNKREEHPEKCRSRTRNMIWYGVLGGRELVNRTYRNLDQSVQLEVDGHKISLPSLQGIVVLNIPSYMGGSNFWGTKKEVDGFLTPSYDDKMLEVVAVLGASQMGMSKVFGGMQHHRISQCHSVKITITDEAVPVQVDGEAWMQPPGIIQIVHKNRATMLKRDRDFEETLRTWNELKQYKHSHLPDPLSERESGLLKPVVDSINALVRSVKAASLINSVVEQELYQSASSLSMWHEKICRKSFTQLVCSRAEISEFLAASKSFINEVNERMWTLKPELSSELETRIASSLSTADQELTFYWEQYFNSRNEELSSTHAQNHSVTSFSRKKSWNIFNRKATLCRSASPVSSAFFDKKPVMNWDVLEVGEWLELIGCGEYKSTFLQRDIRGPELIAFERNDLQELGVIKIGHTKRILEKVAALKKNKKI